MPLASSVGTVLKEKHSVAGVSLTNIFLMHPADCHTSPEVCVGDFSYCVPSGACIGAELHSSLAHTAPEVFSGSQHAADSPQMAWSFGVLLWQLFSGLPPACMMYKEGYQACMDIVCGGSQCNGSASCHSGLSSIKGRCSFLGKVLRAPERDDRIDWVLRCVTCTNQLETMCQVCSVRDSNT